tara:strand:+ start:3103 stop:3660 length:558 start_codon:yes stop_codon:yes gene_type:complete
MGFRSSDYATDYSPDNKFGPVADGTYDCVIKNAYIKDLKTSADQISSEAINYLSEVGDDGVRNGTIKEGDPSKNVRVVFEVEGGQFSGKQFQAYFLFYHSRVDSLRQGRKWLGIMSTAANRPDWDDPMELKGARLKVRVETVRKEWGEVVQPKQYWPIDGKPERRNPQPPPPPEQGTFNDDDIPF